jgi:hypothetical protein
MKNSKKLQEINLKDKETGEIITILGADEDEDGYWGFHLAKNNTVDRDAQFYPTSKYAKE